ncbi:MAG: tol-pal system YbgF family protein, partial [bacterium]
EVGNETNLNEAQPNSSKQVSPETMNMEEYVKLKSRIDALSQGIDTKENEIERLQGSLSERKKLLTSLENKAAKQPMKNLAKTSSMSGFSEIYEEALANYYNKSYSEAISLFKVLLQQYPNHTLASNCQYWIGQSLFAMNRFQESIDAFYKVLSYERSLKKDESLFILGKAYLKIGSGERAKESFSRLIREYPNSEFVEDAKTYIGKL